MSACSPVHPRGRARCIREGGSLNEKVCVCVLCFEASLCEEGATNHFLPSCHALAVRLWYWQSGSLAT